MPATFAHPVFALPAHRLGLPPSALVAGAVAPDVAYLLLPYWRPWTGHTILGIHTFALPVGLLLLFLFHAVAEPAVVDLLPRYVRARIAPYVGTFRWGPAARFVRIVVAVWFGAVTHVFVDAMTHINGQIAAEWPELFVHTHVGGLALYQFLQYSAGLIGTSFLVAWAYQWCRRAPVSAQCPDRRLPLSWWMVLIAVGVIATIWAAQNAQVGSDRYWHQFAVLGAASGLVASTLSVLGLGVVHRLISVSRAR